MSVFALTEFRGANSVSSFRPIICLPKRTHNSTLETVFRAFPYNPGDTKRNEKITKFPILGWALSGSSSRNRRCYSCDWRYHSVIAFRGQLELQWPPLTPLSPQKLPLVGWFNPKFVWYTRCLVILANQAAWKRGSKIGNSRKWL